MSASVNKPADKARLCSELSNLLDHAKSTQELARATAELASSVIVLMFGDSQRPKPQPQSDEETQTLFDGIVGELHSAMNDICRFLSSIRKDLR